METFHDRAQRGAGEPEKKKRPFHITQREGTPSQHRLPLRWEPNGRLLEHAGKAVSPFTVKEA